MKITLFIPQEYIELSEDTSLEFLEDLIDRKTFTVDECSHADRNCTYLISQSSQTTYYEKQIKCEDCFDLLLSSYCCGGSAFIGYQIENNSVVCVASNGVVKLEKIPKILRDLCLEKDSEKLLDVYIYANQEIVIVNKTDIDELKMRIGQLEQELYEERLRPPSEGGSEYAKAKENFEQLIAS